MSAITRDQSRRTLKMAVGAAHRMSITAPLTGAIAGIVAFGEGVPGAGLSLVAGSALVGAIGFMLSLWARVWLLEREPVEPRAD